VVAPRIDKIGVALFNAKTTTFTGASIEQEPLPDQAISAGMLAAATVSARNRA
jgi:hypothetical protein